MLSTLPPEDKDDTDEALKLVRDATRAGKELDAGLSEKARELLIQATREGSKQGEIYLPYYDEGFAVNAGDFAVKIDFKNHREQAQYKFAIKQLAKAELIEEVSVDQYDVTFPGYLVADEILSNAAPPATAS